MPGKKPFLLLFFFFVFNQSKAQLFKLANTLNDNNPPATYLKVKPDGAFLIEGDEEGNILFRNAGNGNIQAKFPAHTQAINHIEFNSTGRLLVSTSLNGEVRVYDFERNRLLHRYKSPGEGMHFALFSIADGFIYFNNRNKLWKIRSDFNREAQEAFISPEPITSAVILPDRSALIFAAGNYINVLNTRNDAVIQQLYAGEKSVERLFLMPDNTLVSWCGDGIVNTWKTKFGQIDVSSNRQFRAGNPGFAAFSFDNKWMLTANSGTWARIWNLADKTIAQELFSHEQPINAFAFAVDAQILFTASKDKTFKVWKQKLDSMPSQSEVKTESVKVDTIKPKPIVKVEESVQKPDVVMASTDIPAKIMGRTVKKIQSIKVKKPTLDIFVYDNEVIDGDTLSLFFNGSWLMKNYGVNKTKKKITLEFNKNSNNYLVLFAENLGTKAPNTAVIQYRDEKGNHIVRLSSDLSLCSAVNFIY
jgi:WD40 repeat protein